jgi:hypothetical protein
MPTTADPDPADQVVRAAGAVMVTAEAVVMRERAVEADRALVAATYEAARARAMSDAASQAEARVAEAGVPHR